jgi:hypothetical protein
MSTGHGCFPPTALVQTPVTKTFFNGKLASVVNSACQHAAHSCGITTHSGSTRSPSSGASKTFIEGKVAARIGVTAGSRLTFNELNPGVYFVRVASPDMKVSHQFKMIKL